MKKINKYMKNNNKAKFKNKQLFEGIEKFKIK